MDVTIEKHFVELCGFFGKHQTKPVWQLCQDMVVNYYQAFIKPVMEINVQVEFLFRSVALIWPVSHWVVHFLYLWNKYMCD